MPTLLAYQLTFQFARSISFSDDQTIPETMEIAVIPLANPSFPDLATYVGGLQTQTVLLTDATNSVSFNLVPSYAAGLSQPVLYRAEWRQGGVSGRTFTAEFAMPSQDVTFDQLADLSDIITGIDYIQQTQIGTAGGIAALNAEGLVVDANGIPVAAQSDIAALTTLIDVEATERVNAINGLDTELSASLTGAINTLSTTTVTNLADAVATLNDTITSNFDELFTDITAETSSRTAVESTLTGEVDSLTEDISLLPAQLALKADLTPIGVPHFPVTFPVTFWTGQITGYLDIAQVPPILLLNAYNVSNESGMLRLSAVENNGELPPIHYGDIAIWANDAVYMLLGDPEAPDPSQFNNWQALTSVVSVNGLQGDVTLTPAVIGAVGNAGTYGTVTQAQVTGLATTLATYTPLTTFNTLNSTVTGILNNTNYVQLDTSGPSSGYINHNKLDTGVAYVNILSEVTLKDGTVIASGTGSVDTVNGQSGPNVTLTAASVGAVAVGGTVPESAVVNLTSDLAARVLTTDLRLSNTRTPTAHAASHQLGGTDALLLDWSQVADTLGTGAAPFPMTFPFNFGSASSATLPTILAAYAPISTTTLLSNEITALQTATTFLLGGGTPTSSPVKANWWDGTSLFAGITHIPNFQSVYNVALKGPWGRSVTTGEYYYNPLGANANEFQFAYITPMGHLQLRTWNEANGPDDVYALQSSLALTNASLSNYATNASFSALESQIAACALQSSLNTTNATMATLATAASVSALATSVANCATQATVNALQTTVNTLATQSSVNSLAIAVANSATLTQQNTNTTNIAALQVAMPIKADLVSGTVPLNELPSLPVSQVTGLQTTLNALCPIVGGLVPLANMPENIPQSYVSGLVSSLANCATLVGGKVPNSQLPSLAINAVFTVANRAALLALSSAVVGDVAILTGTTDQGSYILSALPPSTFGNWVPMENPQGAITSVNGQIGNVVLSAASVGAMAVGVAVPISQVTNLQTTLNSLATSAALTSAVAPLQSLAQVQGTLATSTEIKQLVNFVAINSIVSLAGQQSVDGVLAPLGSIVLATAQPSSVNNGLWVVQSGPWIRTGDYPTNSFFVKGTLAFVSGGSLNANTIWQETATSGIVDTNNSNWAKIMTAGGPVVYDNGNGINLSSSNIFSLNVVPGGGLAVSTAGATVDTSVVARKFSGYVPAGATIATISHGLNTQDLGSVFIKEVASGNQVLACPTVTGPNTCTIEFATAPATNQWRVTILA